MSSNHFYEWRDVGCATRSIFISLSFGVIENSASEATRKQYYRR
jgi:hypothetical protein